jgi:O-antigen/teichoic acid export membrane protein
MKNRCLSSTLAKVVNILSQLTITALISRRLSKEAFGLFSVFLHMMFMVGLFDGGIGGGGLRNALITCRSKKEQRELFFSSFYFIGAIYLTLAVIYALFIHKHLHRFVILTEVDLAAQLKMVGCIFVLSIVIKVPFSIYASGFYAFEEDDKKALVDIAESIALVVAWGLTAFFHQNFLVGYGGYYFILSLMSCVGFVWFLKKRNWKSDKISWITIYQRIRPLFKIHRAFWIQNILSLSLFSCSPYLLMRLMNLEKVGEYILIYRGCCLFLGVHFAFLNPLWASYTKTFHQGQFIWVDQTLRQSLKLTAILLSIGALGMFFFYKPILFLWVGKRIDCDNVVILYAIWMVFYALINCFSVFLNAINLVKKQSVALLAGAIGNIFLGSIFSKIWGVEGVILASIIALLPLFFSNIQEVLELHKRVFNEKGSGC